MSLRQIARELGVSHTLLVLWRQGKRNLSPELVARYHQLVTSGYKNGYNNELESNAKIPSIGAYVPRKVLVELEGLEPSASSMPLKRSPR